MHSESSQEARTWGALLHVSQLANFVIPLAGVIVPVVIWQAKKDQIDGIEVHGRNVANWLISSFIYGIGFGILSFVLIGIPFLVILGLLAIAFPIYGAIKANDGIVWSYPFAIRFFT